MLLAVCGGEDVATLTAGVTASSGVTVDDPCACAVPVVHKGELSVEDLATYQGACLVEVTESVNIDELEDPALLGALAHLRRARGVSIVRSPGLVDLSPLACLRETGSIVLNENLNLADISALDQVEEAERVHLRDIPITHLPSFAPNYKGIRTLYLGELPELRDLDPIFGWAGIHSEETVYDSFRATIEDVPKIESIASLASPLADAVEQASPEMRIQLEFADLPALGSLAGLETFTQGRLELRNLPGIEDLSPLSNLERVRELRISGLPALTSLKGLGALTSAQRLILGGCEESDVMDSLTSLSGVDAMTVIGSDLWIVGAPALASLSAPSLVDVKRFSFVDTPALDDMNIAAFSEQVGASYECVGDIVDCTCIDELPRSVTNGCPSSWEGGSAVIGASTVGPLNGVTAFFGWAGSNYYYTSLILVIVDSDADVESAKKGGVWGEQMGTPKAILRPDRSYFSWIGAAPAPVTIINSSGESASATVELDIQGRLGAWGSSNPDDPPRLYGEIKGSDPNADVVLDGPFDAVFCDDFTLYLSD